MKALGTGARGVAWREIEILPNHRGKPLVYLHGRAAARAERIGLTAIDVSMATAASSPSPSSWAAPRTCSGSAKSGAKSSPASCGSGGCWNE